MSALRSVLLVAGGGALGSVGRYLVGGWAHGLFPNVAFPIGTLLVNTLGCLAIGLIAGLFELRQAFGPDARVFLMVGVLGGFTTFSSFAYETLALARDAEMLRALANVLLQCALGLLAAWLGWSLVRA
jgi:CrcB protein